MSEVLLFLARLEVIFALGVAATMCWYLVSKKVASVILYLIFLIPEIILETAELTLRVMIGEPYKFTIATLVLIVLCILGVPFAIMISFLERRKVTTDTSGKKCS